MLVSKRQLRKLVREAGAMGSMPPEPNLSAPQKAEAAPVDAAAAAQQGMQLAGRPDVISLRLEAWKEVGVDEAIMTAYQIGRRRVGKECRSRWSPEP